MSLSTAVLRELMAAGLSDEALLAACERIERDAPKVVDEQAERRREKDRIRKAEKRLRNSADSAEFHDELPPIKETSPRPPKENYPLSSDPTGLRCLSARKHDWPADFEQQIWSAFPRKTEKKAGIEALARIHRADRVAWADLVNGVEALSDSDPQFVPALARWLKGERWKDERPQARAGPHRQAKRNTGLDGIDELERRYSSNVQQPPHLRIAG